MPEQPPTGHNSSDLYDGRHAAGIQWPESQSVRYPKPVWTSMLMTLQGSTLTQVLALLEEASSVPLCTCGKIQRTHSHPSSANSWTTANLHLVAAERATYPLRDGALSLSQAVAVQASNTYY